MASTRPSAMQGAISRSQQGQLLTLHSLLPPAAENDVLLEIAMRLRSEEGLRYDRRMMLNTIPIIESYDQMIPGDLYQCHNTYRFAKDQLIAD